MRIGVSLASAHPGVSAVDAPNRMLERARMAQGAGLDSLTVGDHHGTGPMPYVQNVPIVARLLSAWDGPVGCLFLVPGWSPVLMAEQIGTLAAMADRRFIVQTGLGGPDLPAMLGQQVSHRGERLEAAIVAVRALLAGERVTDERLGLDGVAVAPVPERAVEWWIGAKAPASLDRAARLGDGWYGDADLTPAAAREQMTIYREACERHGRAPGVMAVRKDVIITADGNGATGLGSQLIDAGYRGGMDRDAVAFGSPDQVAEQLGLFADIGFTDVIVRTMMGTDQSTALETIEQAGVVARLLA